jgi:hypothetical protein
VLDRRQGERRQADRPSPPEPAPRPDDGAADRRRNDRRGRPDVDRELKLTSFAIVTLPTEPPPAIIV